MQGGAVSGACVSFNGCAMTKRGPVLVSMFSPIGTLCSVLLSLFTLGDTITLRRYLAFFLFCVCFKVKQVLIVVLMITLQSLFGIFVKIILLFRCNDTQSSGYAPHVYRAIFRAMGQRQRGLQWSWWRWRWRWLCKWVRHREASLMLICKIFHFIVCTICLFLLHYPWNLSILACTWL